MQVLVKPIGAVIRVHLVGELDHHMAQVVIREIDPYIQKGKRPKIIFDFKDVTFMDSSGVGMVIGRHKKLKPTGGEVGVINLNDRVRRIFEMSGLFKIIRWYKNETEALEGL